METIIVLGVDCNHCAANVQMALDGVAGIETVDIRIPEKIAMVTFDPGKVSRSDITDKVEDVGFDVK